MNVKARISAIRLIEKEKKNPNFFKEIGVATKMKVTDVSTKKTREK